MWFPIGYLGYKWPARSVERLPPFRPQKLRNKILVLGNTGDPVTPVASAKFVVGLLGDQAVMVEQLGFGHTTLAQSSNCTDRIVADHIMRGVVSLAACCRQRCPLIFLGAAPKGEGDKVQGRQFARSIPSLVLSGR